MSSAAYYDFFRKITLQPDNVTLEADSTQDTLTITGGNGVALNPNANTDSFTIDVDYQLYVPIGSTQIRLQDVNSAFTGVSLTPGSNIAITRTNNNELTITATVGAASKSIFNISQSNPTIITTTNNHEFTEGTAVTITDVSGMTELNGNEYFMDILTGNTFALYEDEALTTPLDSTGFTPYSSGGVATANYSSIKTLSGLADVNSEMAQNNDLLSYQSGTWTPTKNIEADVRGSVFADDSSVLVDSINGTLFGELIGNVTGNVTGNADTASNTNLFNNQNGAYYLNWINFTDTPTTLSGYGITDAATSAQGALADSALQSVAFSDLTTTPTTLVGYGITDAATSAQGALADTALQQGDTFVGDLNGSVFADDSTVLVDSVSGFINLINNTTSDLQEGTNLYYTDTRAQNATTGRSIAMSLIFGG